MRYGFSILLLFAIGSSAWAEDPSDRTQPNFIVFIADDMAWDDCGAYGHPHIQTPIIDKLATQGLRFKRAMLTTSSCSPSRCSILSGRYPHNTGAPELHMPLPADQVLLSTPLRKAGYYTASVGKWHLGKEVMNQFDKVITKGGPSGCEHWVPVLRDRPEDKPFFLWLAAFDPHRGYRPGAIPKPHTRADVVVPPYLPDTPEVRDDLALYYDEIGRFDSFVGKVLAELDRQGIADNTFIVVISDNGRPFPRCKTRLMDSGIRTPFIVRWPRGKAKVGSTTDALVSVIDIAPTIVELAGLPRVTSFQGKSFAHVLNDPSQRGRKFAFAEHNWHDYMAFERAAYDQRYTYIRNGRPDLPATPPADAVRSPTYREMKRLKVAGKLTPAQRDPFIAPRSAQELYDSISDPHSLHNLVDDPAHADSLLRLKTALDRWQRETGDQQPDKLTPDGFRRNSGGRLPHNPRKVKIKKPKRPAPDAKSIPKIKMKR